MAAVKQIRFVSLILVVAILIQAAVVFAPVTSLLDYWFTTDDAFYYFQVARNIAEGRGSTFDGIHPANGYHPLWMLGMIPVFSLAQVDPFLPLRLVVLISILLSAGTGLLIFRLLQRVVQPSVALLAGVFWVSYRPIFNVSTLLGMEAGINAFTVLVFLNQAANLLTVPADEEKGSQLFRLGLAACLALFSRLDNAFLVLTVGLVILFRSQRVYFFWLGYLYTTAASVFVSFFIRLGFVDNYPEFLSSLYVFLGFSLVLKLILAYMAGLISPVHHPLKWEILRIGGAVLGAGIIAGGVLILMTGLGWVQNFPRSVVMIDIGITAAAFAVVRFIGLRWVVRPEQDRLTFHPVHELRPNLRRWLQRGILYALPVVVLLGIYLLFNRIVFGTASPVSGQVKHWWGMIPDTVYGKPAATFPALFGLFERVEYGPWWLFFKPATAAANGFAEVFSNPDLYGQLVGWFCLVWSGLVAVGISLSAKRVVEKLHIAMVLPLMMGCLLQILYYTGSYYVNLRAWYWINESLLAVILFALALDGLVVRILNRWLSPIVSQQAARVVAGLMVISLGIGVYNLIPMRVGAGTEAYYLREVRLLEETVPPGSLVGMAGGGSAGYFIRDRTILNLDGLINSYEYFIKLKSGRGREYLDQLGVDYVFGHPDMLTSSAPYYFLLEDRLQPVRRIQEFTLYRYLIP